VSQVGPVQPDFTLPRLQNAADQFEQGSLTGAVGTEQSHYLTGTDGEVNIM
jgi:hypothetical protein